MSDTLEWAITGHCKPKPGSCVQSTFTQSTWIPSDIGIARASAFARVGSFKERTKSLNASSLVTTPLTPPYSNRVICMTFITRGDHMCKHEPGCSGLPASNCFQLASSLRPAFQMVGCLCTQELSNSAFNRWCLLFHHDITGILQTFINNTVLVPIIRNFVPSACRISMTIDHLSASLNCKHLRRSIHPDT